MRNWLRDKAKKKTGRFRQKEVSVFQLKRYSLMSAKQTIL